jgi:CelD/BcsL family acetyltransferase involved in cellulose biosynthesis
MEIPGNNLNTAVKDVLVERPYRLNFYFGEFFVHAVNFRAKALDAYSTRLTEDKMFRQLPVEELKGNTEVLWLISVPVEKKLPRISLGPNSIRYVPVRYPRYYVDVQGTFSDYLQRFSSKTRRELLRQVRKFEKDSGEKPTWREFLRPDEMAEFQRAACDVSKKTYQERLLKKGVPDTADYLQGLEELAHDGRVRGYILYYGNSPIVFHICKVQDGNLMGLQIGYDPAFGKYSPGTVEQYLLLEKLFTEKLFKRFDFGGGESSYKQFFATGKASYADIYYYRRTVRNVFVVAMHSALAVFSDATVAVLERLKLKTWLKKFFRFRYKRQSDNGPRRAA